MLAPDLVAPAYRTVPESFTTLGPEVADLAADISFAPDPEQRVLLDDMNAMKRDQTPVAFEFCVICSRQNLKTGLFKMQAIADAFLFHEPLTIWTAHRFDTTEGAFRDIKQLIDGSDMLTRRVKKITEGNGDEEVTLLDGCLMQFKARGAAGGRGKTGGKVFLDEGLYLQPAHIGSLYPIMATLPGAQVRIGSSAGIAMSAVLRDIRDRGRKGDIGLAYSEWSDSEPPECQRMDCDHARDAPGCCLDDRERWRRSNPAMGRRITEERIATYRRSMPPAEFAREFMGWWDEPGLDLIVITPEAWEKLTDPDSSAPPLAFVVEIDPDRTMADIGMAGIRSDGRMHVESFDSKRGVDWALPRCRQLGSAFPNAVFAVDGSGPAADLAPHLEAAGLPTKVLRSEDVAAACAGMVDAVNQGTVAHGPQDELAVAVAGTRKKVWRDGGFSFGRRISGVNIAPFVSVTLARHVALTQAPLTSVTVGFI